MPTVRERSPGIWTLRVSNGHDPVDGKRVIVTETFRGSERRARARAAEFEREVKRSPVQGGQTTLRKTIAQWRTQAHHADSTARNYDLGERTIPTHLLKTPVDKIRAATLRELYTRVVAEHGVDRTRIVHAVISGALTYAWRQEWLPTNVARLVTPPAPTRRKATTPTPEELQRLLTLVRERPEMYAWLLISAMVGGRPSEILALRWSDIDLARGQLSINKALNPVGGGVKSTKTETERTVAIGPKTVQALEVWREAFTIRAREVGAKPVRDPYVFAGSWDGARPWRSDLATKRFAKLRDRAGVRCRLYDLRHYVATTLLDEGVALKVVGERMGHTRLATTSDKYGHRVHASDQVSAAILERGVS